MASEFQRVITYAKDIHGMTSQLVAEVHKDSTGSEYIRVSEKTLDEIMESGGWGRVRTEAK